ncbi:cardiolipin synthase [Paenibacillus turpanensis]|uniref:cardiolipin synthase n=1 Tax=Paenibacillus turpanensis TaxID=2689078 RepID=UPI00140BBCB7|nr:cardiolipin synthase [Paenibacillus turpanensis]
MTLAQNISLVITLLNVVLAGTVIFLERRNIWATWAWLLVLLFIPVFGFILYLFLGQNLSRRKIYKIRKEDEANLQSLIESQGETLRQELVEFSDPQMKHYQDLILLNLYSGYSLYFQDNEVEIYTDGVSKYEALFADIERAKDHIHLMYYIVRDDELGRRLIRALAGKAAEGVQVRFLYDDIGSSKLPASFFDPLRKAGGQAVAFFPSRVPYMNIRVNYRNHRKIAVIDSIRGYIGGFNVGDEYLGLNPRFGHWRDTHIRITGGAVLQLQVLFYMDWNLASPRLMPRDPRYFSPAESSGKIGMQIVASGPDHEREQIRNLYMKLIMSAKERIWIQTPYFIPDDSIITALRIAVWSGVDVRIMIPGRPDHKMVYWATYSYLGDMLEAGVKCFLYDAGFLHAKTLVVDGSVASVGTANVDIRSFKLNFEANAVLYDTEIAQRLEQIYKDDLEACRELTLELYKQRPISGKIMESVTRLLSPIL